MDNRVAQLLTAEAQLFGFDLDKKKSMVPAAVKDVLFFDSFTCYCRTCES